MSIHFKSIHFKSVTLYLIIFTTKNYQTQNLVYARHVENIGPVVGDGFSR